MRKFEQFDKTKTITKQGRMLLALEASILCRFYR